jgi:two-component system nitrogen regulation response regulator GlnG
MSLAATDNSSPDASPPSLWVIDDDQAIRWVLERAFAPTDFDEESFAEVASAQARLDRGERPDVIVSDIRMPGEDGLSFLSRLAETHPEIPVVIMTAHSDLESAVGAFEKGAFDYLAKPFDIDEAVRLAERAYDASRERAQQTAVPEEAESGSELIGNAPAMQEIFRAIGRLARSSVTVLINGESGTGKELVARALHRHSQRRDGPFVALNTAAIPKDLLESELFGHEKGAFTGAATQRRGRFEQAQGGTLFLDEIGDMPLELQTRLLRVLSDGHFYRVGGASLIQSDVRVIAATHQRLEDLVKEGRFREDLYHRLNVIRLQLPALRERVEDIPQLMRFFLARAAEELEVPVKTLTTAAERRLSEYPWPGNVRELENIARWVTVMAPGNEVGVNDLPEAIREEGAGESAEGADQLLSRWTADLARWAEARLDAGDRDLLDTAGPAFERTLLTAALAHTGGHKQKAAALIGWGRNTVTRKLKELGEL